DKFLAELGLREFNHHLLYHFGHIARRNLRPEFDHFPWRDDEASLEAWKQGSTGYPLVDAGMRQLWATGFMHNRVRMVVASFLVKHLLIDWREGEAWFWDTLVDACAANNPANWQWSAGSGADAQPFFRIFNPVSQGERFDPNGDYVRRWVPELRDLPAELIHKPWEAGGAKGYPRPIVDHALARARALEAFKAMRAEASTA
ncbi:MAG: cryptochrome/photolyase family protein, partial [Caulobacteraceae bacterium]